ncbi:MAG: DUF4230 domain-containing protein [Saccharofermentanales bacterium]
MKTKTIVVLFLISVLSFTLISCDQITKKQTNIAPQGLQMQYISELATIKCYYHNVAKYTEEDTEGIWFWQKDTHFWIEYSGIVKVGIDASLVSVNVQGDSVIITIPKAKVLSAKVDEASLNPKSFYVAIDSAKISGNDETMAYDAAQKTMVLQTSKDSALLARAQQRAQTLLEKYVKNIGKAIGKEYIITWDYLNTEGDDSTNSLEEITNSEDGQESN